MMPKKPTPHFCEVFGHNLKHVADIDNETSELVCKTCKNYFISVKSGDIMNISVFGELKSLSNYFKRRKSNALRSLIDLK
ncbi:MAG: hypothetical protein ACON5F_12630 [Jejuia sp.]